MRNTLLFLGKTNSRRTRGDDGVILKNRIFFDSVRQYFGRSNVVDLDTVRQPATLLNLLLALWSWRYRTIVVASGGSVPSCQFVSLVQRITPPIWFGYAKLYILGLGGNMHLYLRDNPKGVAAMKRSEAVLAEGKQMKKDMEAMGISPVYYMPNFKNIVALPEKKRKTGEGRMRFLFFSRINPAKGCDLIFEAIEVLLSRGLGERFEVGFYGMMLEDYREEFEGKIKRYGINASYHGVLDGTDTRSHEMLASYDAFLFPTYWNDEGFPAAIVDAFIAGLPVIASDWNCNGELIRDGENGFLIPPKDSKALAEKMEWLICHPEFIKSRAASIQEEALQYDTKHVIRRDFLMTIGMIRR